MRRCLQCSALFSGDRWRCAECRYEPEMAGKFPAFAPDLSKGEISYDPAHYRELAAIEMNNYWFRARNRLIIWAIRKYFPGAKSFLEVGCGTGFVLAGIARAFPGIKVAGSEVSSEGLDFAAARVPGAELMQMDARRIPFREEFGVIGAFDVLEHIEDDVGVLNALRDAVVPGGGLLLTVPQHPFLWSRYDVCAGHVRRYGARELREKVSRCGFEILRMTSFVSFLLPLMAASRLARTPPQENYDPLADLRVPRWINALSEGILAVERGLISGGLSFPAGGSLLLAARRAA